MRIFTSLSFATCLGLAIGCMKKDDTPQPAPKVEGEAIITPAPAPDPNKKLDPDPTVGPVIGANGVPMPRLSKNQTISTEVSPLPDPIKKPLISGKPSIINPIPLVEPKPKPVVIDPKPPIVEPNPPTSGLEVAPPPREKK